MAQTYSKTRGPAFADFYAAAQRHGIKLLVSSGSGANCMDVETVLSDVVQEEAQPALLACVSRRRHSNLHQIWRL